MNLINKPVEYVYSSLNDIYNDIVVDESEALEALDDLGGIKMKVLEKIRPITSKVYFNTKNQLQKTVIEYISDIVKFKNEYNAVLDDTNVNEQYKEAVKNIITPEVKAIKKSVNSLVKKINEHNAQTAEDSIKNKFMFYLSEMAKESNDVKEFLDINKIFYASIIESKKE